MASKDLVKGYCKESKCEYDVYTKEKTDEILTGKVLTDIDLSEVLTPGIYVLGDNVTDTKNEGTIGIPLKYVVLEVSSNREIADNFDQLNKTVYQRITAGTDQYSREIFVNEEWSGASSVFNWGVKGQKAILTGSITMPVGETSAYVDIFESDLPEGFTPSNSVVISKSYNITTTWSYSDNIKVSHSNPVATDDFIRIHVSIGTAETSEFKIRYRVVLMKID